MGTNTFPHPSASARKPASRTTMLAPVSVANALFGGTQQRVLGLLFGQPERSFFTKELINLIGGGSGAVQRELARLLSSGLIVQTMLGNQKHYRANADAPIFAELCGIAAKILGPADTLRRALLPLADELHLALLYGSVAKGSDTARSDFDVLLVSDTLMLVQVYNTLATAEQQLGRRVSPLLYTLADFRKRLDESNPFLIKVLAGKTVVLIGDKRAFTTAG